jgi:hypothetical protein
LYTDDCRASSLDNYIIKFAGDSALVSLIRENDDQSFFTETNKFVQWCKDNALVLNVKKKKEMIFNFKKKLYYMENLVINSETIETVKQYKYLGIYIKDDLKWDAHNENSYKKALQRMYCLRIN